MDADYQHPTSLLSSTTPTILHKYLWFDMHRPEKDHAQIMRNLTKSTVYERNLPLEDIQKPWNWKKQIPMIFTIKTHESFTLCLQFFGGGEHDPKSECRTSNHELSSACCFFWEDSEGGYTILHNIR